MTDVNDRTPAPWSPCAGATVPDIPEGMALEVEWQSSVVTYVSHEDYGTWRYCGFAPTNTRYRLIPWPMTPREKFQRLAEALGDGFRVSEILGSCVGVGEVGSPSNRRSVVVYDDGEETFSGPRDFNRRAFDLLDQLQIGRDDVAAMVGGKNG